MKLFFTACLFPLALGVAAQSVAPNPVVEDTPKIEAAAMPIPKKWICAGDGLAEFRYDGGNWANIRLAAYSTGGSYRVTKDQSGDVARGVTADRTPFVCTNK